MFLLFKLKKTLNVVETNFKFNWLTYFKQVHVKKSNNLFHRFIWRPSHTTEFFIFVTKCSFVWIFANSRRFGINLRHRMYETYSTRDERDFLFSAKTLLIVLKRRKAGNLNINCLEVMMSDRSQLNFYPG